MATPPSRRGVAPRRSPCGAAPAFEGLATEGVLNCEATRLDELRLGAAEDRIDADLRLGRHAEVIAELGVLTPAHPLRERLHGF